MRTRTRAPSRSPERTTSCSSRAFFRDADFDGKLVGLEDAGPDAGNAADVAVVKVDTNGKAIWAMRIAGVKAEDAHGIAVDAQGDIYLTGRLVLSIRDGRLVHGHASRKLGAFRFLVKLNGASGMPMWAQSLGGEAGVTRCAAVAANGADVAVACNFEAPVMPYTTVDGVTATLLRQGVVSAFVARLDAATGKARWATAIYAAAEARGLAVLPGGDVFVGGRFSGSLSDTAGSSMLPIAARGDTDAFLMRLAAADGKARV